MFGYRSLWGEGGSELEPRAKIETVWRSTPAVDFGGQLWQSCLAVNSAGRVCVAAGRPDEQNLRCRRAPGRVCVATELTAGVNRRR